MLRVRVIAEALASGKRVVAILDEPFKGTNVKDALDASLAILQRLAARENSLFMFSSHLIELSQPLSEVDGVDCHYRYRPITIFRSIKNEVNDVGQSRPSG